VRLRKLSARFIVLNSQPFRWAKLFRAYGAA
jgi:hypothetical protein